MSDPTIKSLSRLKPYRGLLAVAYDWGVIALAIAVSEYFRNPLVYLLAVLVIGSRQHALGILLHEAVHYRLSKSRRLNDAIGEALLAWPISTTLHAYRRNHLTHHRHTNTDADPDWVRCHQDGDYTFPKTRGQFIGLCLSYLFGLKTISEMKKAASMSMGTPPPRPIIAGQLALYATVIGLSIWLGFWLQLILYWIVPFLTVFIALIYLRGVAEHFGGPMDYGTLEGGTRNVVPSRLERFFIAPHNVHYHLDHHLIPAVPYYNLPALHALLMKDPDFARQEHSTRGYLTGLIREITGPAEAKPQKA